ncbi:hypothetical protein J6590_035282 [Homalodisca vitripennis]|nr:hypothetical protein J6590_035282 [Homalodisca vitripennis]
MRHVLGRRIDPVERPVGELAECARKESSIGILSGLHNSPPTDTKKGVHSRREKGRQNGCSLISSIRCRSPVYHTSLNDSTSCPGYKTSDTAAATPLDLTTGQMVSYILVLEVRAPPAESPLEAARARAAVRKQ